MSSTFAGQSFNLLGRGFQRSRKGQVSVRQMPGGDTSYVDRGGRKLPEIGCTIIFATFAAYRAFEALVSQSGTLVHDVEGSMTATLMEVLLVAHYPGGQVEATAQFTVTG